MTTSLTRQHFRAIADAIAKTPGLLAEERRQVAEEVASALRQFNPRFDRDRFIAAATASGMEIHRQDRHIGSPFTCPRCWYEAPRR